MKNISTFLFLVLLPLMGLDAPAVAEPADELIAIQAELAGTTEKQGAIVRRIAEALQAQEEASAKLVELAKTAATQEAALEQATDKLDKLQRENAKALLALAGKREALSKLLAGLQRMEQNPPPALVVAPDDVLQALRGAMMFGTVIPELRQQTDDLRQALSEVAAIKSALEEEKARTSAALDALVATRTDISALVEERQAAAAQIATELASEQEKSASLAAKAETLKDLVANLERAKAVEAERIRREEDARTKAAALVEAQALALAEAQAKNLAEAQRRKEQEKPAMVFSAALGKLDLPVQGSIWREFGEDNGLDGRTAGVFVSSQAMAQVLSPVDGMVEFAGQFRTYDQVVIINPGEGYLVLLAGMKQITATQGQSVRAGEPLGTLGDRSAPMQLIADLSQTTTPVLYVEFRKNNKPVDPTPWWSNRRKEAMR